MITVKQPAGSGICVTAPYRDSHHAKWDGKALGCQIPIVAICEDKATIINME